MNSMQKYPPLFKNTPHVNRYLETRGGILHNFPNPKNFRLRRAYKTGFRDIYIVFRLCSPPQAENFDILRFYNAILLRKPAFSASKSSNFRLRRKVSDKFQNLQTTRGEFSIRIHLIRLLNSRQFCIPVRIGGIIMLSKPTSTRKGTELCGVWWFATWSHPTLVPESSEISENGISSTSTSSSP